MSSHLQEAAQLISKPLESVCYISCCYPPPPPCCFLTAGYEEGEVSWGRQDSGSVMALSIDPGRRPSLPLGLLTPWLALLPAVLIGTAPNLNKPSSLLCCWLLCSAVSGSLPELPLPVSWFSVCVCVCVCVCVWSRAGCQKEKEEGCRVSSYAMEAVDY